MADETEFLEEFVFAESKEEVLKKLTVQNEKFFYYNILFEQLQSPEPTDREIALMDAWMNTSGGGAKFRRMSTRHEFRKFVEGSPELPQSLIKMLKDTLSPQLQHRPQHSRAVVYVFVLPPFDPFKC
jgi:hypothetical protein